MVKQGRSGLISHGSVAQNRRARHEYAVEETVEAGMQLTGTEVKSLRHGRANIAEAFAGRRSATGRSSAGGASRDEPEEIWLYNANIPEYDAGNRFNHEPKRPRRLLLKKREIRRLLGAVSKEGMTLVPLSVYFNDRGIAKLQLGLAKGKKAYDKRQTAKDRDWNRQKQRLMREKG